MKTIAITIPTKTYLRKYIHKRYGYPVALNYSNLFSTVVMSFLQKRLYCDSNPQKMYQRYVSFSDFVEVVFPSSKYFNTPFELRLNPEKVVILNRYFEHQFEEDLYRHCQASISHQKNRIKGFDKSIEKFAEMHDLVMDQDITFECLKKMEYRFRKNLEKKYSAIVPSSQGNGKHKIPQLF